MTARFGALGTFAKSARKNHQRMREGLDLLQKSPPYFDSPEYQDYRAKCLEAEMSALATVVFAAMAAEAYIYDLGASCLPTLACGIEIGVGGIATEDHERLLRWSNH